MTRKHERTDETTTAPVTPARQWKRTAQDGERYQLPGSGHTAQLRRPGLTGMAIRAGNVPNRLSAAVLRFLAESPDPLARPTEKEMVESFERNSRAYAEIAALAFVSPRLILDREPNYDNDEIGPTDLTDVDYVWLVSKLVEGRAAELVPFRAA